MATVFSSLHTGFTEPVRDALWGHVYLPPAMEAITRTEPFIRLHHVSQLGPASLRYPGATHTRASHSLGVYHIARRLLQNLAEQEAGWFTPTGCRSFLCAALLHDIGHFPYAHSLRELPLLDHETLSGRTILAEPIRSLVGKAGADAELCAAIVDQASPVPASSPAGQAAAPEEAYSDAEPRFYRKLLSGTLDPDKLDYLNRDARFCGVPYGAQDVDFILSTLHPHRERGVDIDERGVASVESLLFSKYLMYRSVYWHHSVRAATSCLKKALFAALRDNVIAAEELYGLDDEGLFALLAAREHPLFPLALNVRRGALFCMIAEFPFDPLLYPGLDDIARRAGFEDALAGEISSAFAISLRGSELVIDVPEPVSFESELFLTNSGRPFSERSSLFKGEAAEAFSRALRVVRIFVDRKYEHSLKSPPSSRAKLEKILHSDKRWL